MVGTAEHRTCRMRVVDKSAPVSDVVVLRLADPDGAPVSAWQPGAHIDLLLEPGTVRQYSLCGDPRDDTALTIAVLRVPDGRGGSAMVHDKLTEGDLVEVGQPRNNFELVDAPSYLFVAGGIGITPLRPMIREVERAGARWRLVYGGRTRATMAFADELAAAHPESVELRPQDEYGLLDLAGALAATEDGAAVYCCGPEPLLAAVESLARERDGFGLHVERFAPGAAAASAVDDGFEVELRRSGRTVGVAPSETVLDALERAGLAPEFSCREGVCGTCEVAVLGGAPDHRDSVLSAEERQAGDAMMVCVSRCLGAKLVLDL